MSRYPKPRKYTVKKKEKYIGDPNNVVMRSSWEVAFATWCEMNPSVIEWSSETVVIPYRSPLDDLPHRYYVDFWAKIKDKTGSVITYLIEIKPHVQCLPPDYSKRKRKPKQETIQEEVKTYAVNQAKWKCANEFARRRGWKFKVLTEYELGLAK